MKTLKIITEKENPDSYDDKKMRFLNFRAKTGLKRQTLTSNLDTSLSIFDE